MNKLIISNYLFVTHQLTGAISVSVRRKLPTSADWLFPPFLPQPHPNTGCCDDDQPNAKRPHPHGCVCACVCDDRSETRDVVPSSMPTRKIQDKAAFPEHGCVWEEGSMALCLAFDPTPVVPILLAPADLGSKPSGQVLYK